MNDGKDKFKIFLVILVIILGIIVVSVTTLLLTGNLVYNFKTTNTNAQTTNTTLNNSNNNSNSNTLTENNTTSLETNKVINLTATDKDKYNKRLKEANFQLLLDTCLNNLNNSSMVNYAMFLQDDSSDDFKNNSTHVGGPEYLFNFNYVKKVVSNVFEKEITTQGLSMSGNQVSVSFPTGFGIRLFRIDKLVLDETTNIYTMTINEYTPTDKNIELSNTSVSSSLEGSVINTYEFKYKVNTQENEIIVSINKI